MNVLVCAILAAISVLGIMGNIFVFWAVIVDKRLRTPSNLFILSLAASDLLLASISVCSVWIFNNFLINYFQ